MLGTGTIYLEKNDLHKWRAGGRVSAEISLALMWPSLGAVKRAQAELAIDAVQLQYAEGRIRSRPAKYRPLFVPHTAAERTDDARRELAWAAGFFDAEGCFSVIRKNERRDGTFGFRVRASASQHGAPNLPAEVLIRLQRTLGGRIERHGDIDDFKWVAEGDQNVRSVFEKLRPWLGEVKLAQARAALDTHEASRVRGGSDRCIRGHVYDSVEIRADGTIRRRCSACDRIRGREKRAAQGAIARVVRNPSSDSSRVYAT
jgi:hypothetical protein